MMVLDKKIQITIYIYIHLFMVLFTFIIIIIYIFFKNLILLLVVDACYATHSLYSLIKNFIKYKMLRNKFHYVFK